MSSRAQVADATRRLIDWATRVEFDAIPREVASRAGRIIADDLAAIVAARDEPEVRCFHDVIVSLGRAPEATLFRGGRPRTDRSSAAIGNGLAADSLEVEGGYRKASCHGGLFTLPALLADSESEGLKVRDVLRALTASYEVVTRVARGWKVDDLAIHGHARYAAIGAAAASALARRLPLEIALGAITGAATLLNAGPHEHGTEGALIRNAWPAAGAANGMMSVTWAQCGITGLPEGLYDVFTTTLGGEAQPERLIEGLGESWAVMDAYSKMHACCQYAHSAVEAVLAARGEVADAAEIEEIVVGTHRLALPMTNARPPTTLAGKFSMEHIVATTLVHGHADVAAFASGTLKEPRIAALRERVTLVPYGKALAPPNDRPARVTVKLKGGRAIERECLSAPGGPDQPFPDALVMEKVERLTADVYPRFSGVMKRLIALDNALLDRTWDDVVGDFTGER